MNLSNLMAISIETFGGFGSPFNLNWIGIIIKWLIESTSSIGIGIILFTLALKLLTLPLDIISRASMKKNSLKLERIKPELEKCQRQYANNKQLYAKKIQAVYKKEGYSMLSTCLPTIVMVFVFIVVVNQFSTYSDYANLETFNKMSGAYTTAVENYDETIVFKEKVYIEKKSTALNVKKEDDKYFIYSCYLNENNAFNTEYFADVRQFMQITSVGEKPYLVNYSYTDIKKLGDKVKKLNQNGFDQITVGEDTASNHLLISGETYVVNETMFSGLTNQQINDKISQLVMEKIMTDYATETVKSTARQAAKDSYEENAPSFLWVKNLWLPDLPYKHPVSEKLTDYSFARSLSSVAKQDQAQYSEITYLLGEQKSQPNGYFILVVLSIGTMLLSQWIATQSQKTQTQLSTVDGSAMQQQKMMMWMMPIMFGVFSFMYSASFSLYMTVSTILSVITTLIINFFVERAFRKQTEKIIAEREDKRFRRK